MSNREPCKVYRPLYSLAPIILPRWSWHSLNVHGTEGSWREWTELAFLCQQLGSDQGWLNGIRVVSCRESSWHPNCTLPIGVGDPRIRESLIRGLMLFRDKPP